MTNKKATKRALLTSVLAIVMCLVMLIGSTFAWFTDTASTGVNQIQSGNLHVKLMYSEDMQEWKEATEDTKLLNGDALWEPGHTEIVYLKVVNTGNLALKYEMKTNNYGRGNRGKNADGKFFYIDTYLRIGLAETDKAYGTRDEAITAVAANDHPLAKKLQITKGWATLEAGKETDPLAVVIYMPTTVGNEANYVTKSVPTLKELGLVVNATQASVESDSYGPDYDATAPTAVDRIELSGDNIIENESYEATGKWGVIQVMNGTTVINNTNITALELDSCAQAIYAENDAKVIINSGNFTQVTTGNSDMYELIYALDNAEVTINGGTFKCVTPKWTLNCLDGTGAKFIVNGGRFWKFNPATDNPGEVVLGEGHTVTQDGDWFVVS